MADWLDESVKDSDKDDKFDQPYYSTGTGAYYKPGDDNDPYKKYRRDDGTINWYEYDKAHGRKDYYEGYRNKDGTVDWEKWDKDKDKRYGSTSSFSRGGFTKSWWSGSSNLSVSPVRLAQIARRVRQTASMVSLGHKIETVMGAYWAADVDADKIIWRPTSPLPPCPPLSDAEVLHLITHEAGHLEYTGQFWIPDAIGFRSGDEFHLWQRFVNGGEDIRIERLLEKKFKGFRNLRREFTPRILNKVAELTQGHLDPADAVMHNFHRLEMGMDTTGDPAWQQFSQNWWPVMGYAAQAESCDKLSRLIWDMYKAIMKNDPTAMPPQGEPQESSDSGKMSGDILDALSQRLKGALTKALQNMQAAGITGELVDALSDALSQLGMADNESVNAQDVLQESKKAEEVSPISAGASESSEWADAVFQGSAWAEAKEAQRPNIGYLTRRLKAILQTNAIKRWMGGKRRGRFDVKRIPKTAIQDYNVFKKRENIGTVDYCFGFLPDISGSMARYREPLTQTTVLFAEVLDNLGLDYFVLPWGDEPSQFHKPVSGRLRDYAEGIAYMTTHTPGGTVEWKALAKARQMFLESSAPVRVLILFTDGTTSVPQLSEHYAETLRDEGIHTIGVGFGVRGARLDYFDEKIVFTSIDDLIKTIPQILREHIRRGV